MPKTPDDNNQMSFADLADHASLNGKTLYLVDGSSYIYRAFYAIRNLSNSAGMPTNAIYGFTQMLKKLIEDENPDLIAVTFDAFDADEHTFRKELYDDYKANRSAMPDELRIQIPYFRKVVEALNIPIMEQAGVEADDLIATATVRAREVGLNVCIISADKDLMQLLGDGVSMLDTMRGRRYSPADVLERFNVTPDRVKFVLALAGDTSDNIPGVPGIGEKTGGKLIAEFGDLETLLANIDKVSGKKRKENLTEFADQARLSLELVTLRDDCPIAFDIEHLHLSPPDFQALAHLFHELEFESVLHDLNRWFKSRGWLDDRDIEDLKDSLLDEEITRTDEARKDYRAIFTLEELDEVLAACKDAGRFAFDLETTSVDPLEARIVGMSFAYKPNHGVYIPVAHSYEGAPAQLSLDEVLARVAPLLEDPDLPKIGQHYKYEWLVLRRHNIGFQGVAFDTMLMSYVLDPGKNSHGLDTIAFDFLNHRNIKFSDVAGRGKKQLTFDQVPLDKATPYAAEDADITLMACDALLALLDEEPELRKLHDTLEIPLSRVLGVMELNGVKVDCDILNQLSAEFEVELEKLQDEINVHAGSEVNPNSPTQLREVLFERLELPVKKRTKTGPSTDQSVLEQLSELHPLPRLILEYRSFSKLKGTYVDALPELIREDTGRIHTDFNQAVAATGRLSSSNPNLQNIPIRTDRGREIRKAFVADEGHLLLAADYSQIELRIMAHLSGDPVLLKAYKEGQDIHALTASQIFDIDIDEVSGDQRRAGKTINFGVMYGMGPRRLARDLDISMPEAKSYIDNYFERYQGVATYFEKLVADAVETGYALTMFGRKRLLPTLENKGAGRAFAERAAINTPIQGTAADIIKLAMIAIQDRIEAENWPARMLLQVHDELIFEIAEDALDELRPKICNMMETIVTLDAPLIVDSGVGKNWFDAK
ncbi:DNA polymerase I [Lujinxingia vulgaris]|nr:DNA polymerase I [Lujinxingia vulgaris]